MSRHTTGWMIFVAAFGLICIDIGNEIRQLENFPQGMVSGEFIGETLIHIGTVIGAFVGGKLIPENRDPEKRTRATDSTLG